MTSYNDDTDELMGSRSRIAPKYNPRPPNTMNTRAPTDFHARKEKGVDSLAAVVSYSYEDDMPDDEGAADKVIIPDKKEPDDDLNPPDWTAKRVRSRKNVVKPWSTSAKYDNVNTHDDDDDDNDDENKYGYDGILNVVNIPNRVSPRSDSGGMLLEDEDLSLSDEDGHDSNSSNRDQEDAGLVSNSSSGMILDRIKSNKHAADSESNGVNDTSLESDVMGLTARWATDEQEVEREAAEANVKAVGLAAERAANRTLQEEEEEESRYLKDAAAKQIRKDHFEKNPLTDVNTDNDVSNVRARGSGKDGYAPASTNMGIGSPNRDGRAGVLGTALSRARESVSSLVQKPINKEELENMTAHERVRLEALKMLQLADHGEDEGAIKGLNKAYSLRKTKSGGYSTSFGAPPSATDRNDSRFSIDEDNDDVDLDSPIRTPPSKRKNNTSMEEIQIEEEDDIDHHYNDLEGGNKDKPKNSWGSRYSIDRHMRALHGGLSSKQVLNKMDQDHYKEMNNNKSANKMFKSSPYDDSANSSFSKSHHNNFESDTKARASWNPSLKIKEFTHFLTNFRQNKTDGTANNLRSNPRNLMEEDNTTFGSYRKRDHSSTLPRKGIFTGIQIPNIFSSPKNADDSTSPWNNINLVDRSRALPSIPFSPNDDYAEEQRVKRRRKMCIFLISAIALVASVATAYVLVPNKRGNVDGTITNSYISVGEVVSFYVTSDTPYNEADASLLRQQLDNLKKSNNSDGGTFLIHLGDVGLASQTLCAISVYEDARDILESSPIPTFVIPGNNDWNDCPNPEAALSNWKENLNRMEERFQSELPIDFPIISRQLGRDENFSFLHKGVLFIGLNLVNGRVQNEREWTIRHQQNVQWTEENLNAFDKDEYRAVVIFGHAPPTAKVGDYFWPITSDLKEMFNDTSDGTRVIKPVLYMHANDGGEWTEYKPFKNVKGMVAVQMEKGGTAEPVKVEIKFGPLPFTFDV